MNAPQQITQVGRYKVLEKMGKGGMGVLYRGFDPVLDREVAIKLMLADFTDDAEQMRPRFYREAMAAAKLNHRNIVTIFEFAEESNTPYIVMEFLRGTPLGSRMGSQPPLSLDDKLNIVAQLCEGLTYAHEQGVVHRDVKPDNVFILEDGSVKLLDFGIAKLTSSNLTRQGDVLGSASYMSPEQVGGSDAIDGRADVFSTGVMLYELLCGHKPFEADEPTAVILKILRDDPTPLETHVTGLPPQLVAAVLKALAKRPDDRWESADALGRELQSIRQGVPATVSTAELDQTRMVSTQNMKALHEDFEKLRETGTGGSTATGAGQAAAEAPVPAAAPTSAPAPAASKMVPALVGAVVVLALALVAVVIVVVLGSRQPLPTAVEDPSAPAATGQVVAGTPQLAETGSVFINFLNTYSEGAIEVEVDGRKRWSQQLGTSQQGGGISTPKPQRVSEQIGSQLKIAAGVHKFTVTILNGDGEVRDSGMTSFQVAASRPVTLRVRTTGFKNQLQLDVVPGQPITK